MGDTVAVVKNEYEISVVTNGTEELFNLKENPNANSLYVEDIKNKLMSSLDLRVVVENLYNTADLLYVSYNALEGTSAKSMISGLQTDLAQLCGDSQVAMNSIEVSTAEMLGLLPTVYRMLVSGKSKQALQILSKASSYANAMAAAADKLADKVEEMIGKATNALERSENLYAEDVQKKKDFANKLAEMKAKQEALVTQKEEMQGIIDDLQEQCLQAKLKEEKADKRAFTMGIIGSFTGLLNIGIGEAISSLAGPKNDASSAEANQKKEEQEAQKKQLEEKISNLKKQIADIEQKEKDESLSQEEKDELKEEKEKLNKELDSLNKDYTSVIKALEVSKKLCDEIENQVNSKKSQAQQAAEKAAQQSAELQKQKLKMQQDQMKVKSDLAQLAVQVKNQANENMSLETAIKMLQLAIQCLGNIVSALQATAIFWRGIESGCKNLADSSLISVVEALQPLDSEDQNEIYLENSFMLQMLSYMSTWVALNIISHEYAAACLEAGKTVRYNVSHPKFGKDAYETAKSLADSILSRME